MRAFHGSQEIKDNLLKQVHIHRLLDEIEHGTYWTGGKGCAIGCTVHSGCHRDYEVLIGIQENIAHMEDVIFENMNNAGSFLWPEAFIAVIPVGADLSLVAPKMAAWLFDPEGYNYGVHVGGDKQRFLVTETYAIFMRFLGGEKVPMSEWVTLKDSCKDEDGGIPTPLRPLVYALREMTTGFSRSDNGFGLMLDTAASKSGDGRVATDAFSLELLRLLGDAPVTPEEGQDVYRTEIRRRDELARWQRLRQFSLDPR